MFKDWGRTANQGNKIRYSRNQAKMRTERMRGWAIPANYFFFLLNWKREVLGTGTNSWRILWWSLRSFLASLSESLDSQALRNSIQSSKLLKTPNILHQMIRLKYILICLPFCVFLLILPIYLLHVLFLLPSMIFPFFYFFLTVLRTTENKTIPQEW